jgi:hypothetical protein
VLEKVFPRRRCHISKQKEGEHLGGKGKKGLFKSLCDHQPSEGGSLQNIENTKRFRKTGGGRKLKTPFVERALSKVPEC